MQRRAFLKCAATGGAAVVATPGLLLIEGCSPSWEQDVLNDIPVILNIVQSVTGIVQDAANNGTLGAAVLAAINTAAAVATQALTTLQTAVNAYQSGKSQGTLAAVSAAITAVQSSIAGIMDLLPQTATEAKVQTAVVAALGIAVVVISGIEALVPAATSVTAKAKLGAALGKASVPNVDTLKFGYNAVLQHAGLGHTI